MVQAASQRRFVASQKLEVNMLAGASVVSLWLRTVTGR